MGDNEARKRLMFKKRILAFIFLPMLLGAFLHAQSVADLAKKEKERRAAIKGKPATVITNADLGKVKKKPAVEVAAPEKTGDQTQGQTPPATEQAAGTEQAGAGQVAAEPKPAQETP